MKKKKKIEVEINPYYAKIRKEVKHSYYNYHKTFVELIGMLNQCKTKKELELFITSCAQKFKEQDAPDDLVEYLYSSITNKITTLEKRDDIDLGKLRAISNYYK